jgi:DNA-binding MarR family transcriptional regulator
MIDTVKQVNDGSLPLAPLLRLAWQEARRRIYDGLRQAGYEDLGLADLAVFQFPTPEGARPTDLADRALMTKQAVNRIIRHLEESGYLRLEPAASDHRARVVRLTARGQRVLATIRELHAEIEAEWADRIGRHQLTALRRTMTDLIEGMSGPAEPPSSYPMRS